MQALVVVEVKIPLQPGFQLRHCGIVVEVDVLVFERPPQAFDEHVVQRPPASIVAYRHLGVLQACSKRLAGELYPLVAVEDLRGSKRERRLQGLQTKGNVLGIREPPRHYIAAVPVQDRYQLHINPWAIGYR